MQVTLRQLQVFLAVANTKSLTQAADTLFMSKSAVSQALTELESRLGVVLFDRKRTRLLLNSHGLRLMPKADEILLRSRELGELFSSSASYGYLTLGVTHTIGSFMLADMLADFERRYGWLPDVTVSNTRRIETALKDFEIDLAIVEGPVSDKELTLTPWCEDELIVLAPKTHPLTQCPAVTWEMLSQVRWVLREEGSGSRVFFETKLRPYLLEANVALSVNSFDTILGAVHAGLGLTFISSRVLARLPWQTYFRALPLPERFYRQFTLVRHRAKYVSSDMALWSNFCETWRS